MNIKDVIYLVFPELFSFNCDLQASASDRVGCLTATFHDIILNRTINSHIQINGVNVTTPTLTRHRATGPLRASASQLPAPDELNTHELVR